MEGRSRNSIRAGAVSKLVTRPLPTVGTIPTASPLPPVEVRAGASSHLLEPCLAPGTQKRCHASRSEFLSASGMVHPQLSLGPEFRHLSQLPARRKNCHDFQLRL